jgi:hypothetical protein
LCHGRVNDEPAKAAICTNVTEIFGTAHNYIARVDFGLLTEPLCLLYLTGGLGDRCGLMVGDEVIAVNEASLSGHYLESVIAVIDSTLDSQPVTLTVRRLCQKSSTSRDTPPPPLPTAAPPPLPAAPPPIHRKIPSSDNAGFSVDEEGWSFIDDESSQRHLVDIQEEEDAGMTSQQYLSMTTAYEQRPVNQGLNHYGYNQI